MLERGRPVSITKRQEELDKAISAWDKYNPEMHHAEIHKAFFNKGLVEENARYQTSRILNRLIDVGYVKKLAKGLYKMTIKPEEFNLFDYLARLRKQAQKEKLILNWTYGGFTWAFNDGCYLGMPEEVEDHSDVRFIFAILNERMASIFESYRELAIVLRQRRESKEIIPLPERFYRQALVEIIPWWLESQAGADLDGLSIDSLRKLIPSMIEALPNEYGDGKHIDNLHLDHLEKLLPLITRPLDEAMKIEEWGTPFDDRSLVKEKQPTTNQFAMIITEPEFLIDEMSHEVRSIYDRIERWSKQKGIADEYIAFSLPQFEDSTIVLETLSTYGARLLGNKRAERIISLYKKIQVSNWLSFLHRPRIISRNEIPATIKKQVAQLLKEGHKPEDLVRYLAHSRGPADYHQPSEDKIIFLQNLFSDLPKEKVRKLYLEGVDEINKFAEIAFEYL